jgi:hypothetical protein
MARTKGSGFKMKAAAHGGPMRRNFPSAFRKETEPTAVATDSTATPSVKEIKVEEPHWNWGATNEEGTKIMDKGGNWVSLMRGTEGKAIQENFLKSQKRQD